MSKATEEKGFPKTRDSLGASPTPAQRETLAFIREYAEAEGVTPTYQEIAGKFGISKTSVSCRVVGLWRRGLVNIRHYKARGLQLVGVCPCCGTQIPIDRGSRSSPGTPLERPSSARNSRSSAE